MVSYFQRKCLKMEALCNVFFKNTISGLQYLILKDWFTIFNLQDWFTIFDLQDWFSIFDLQDWFSIFDRQREVYNILSLNSYTLQKAAKITLQHLLKQYFIFISENKIRNLP